MNIEKEIRFIRYVIILLVIILMFLVGILTYDTINNKYDPRDVNRDGKISAVDYSLIKAYLLEKENK
jgi:uncharacterized membrane protein